MFLYLPTLCSNSLENFDAKLDDMKRTVCLVTTKQSKTGRNREKKYRKRQRRTLKNDGFFSVFSGIVLKTEGCSAGCGLGHMFLLMSLDGESELVGIGAFVHHDGVAGGKVAVEQQFAHTVLDVVLNGALQWAGAKLHIVAFGGDKLLGLVAYFHAVAHGFEAVEEAAQFDVDDLLDGRQVELVEGDYFVESVEKLGRELAAEALLDDGAGILLVFLVGTDAYATGIEAYAAAELLELACAGV